MQTVWLDCEFNGFGGELVSMGMVAADGSEWYETVGCKAPTPWVKEHVLPFLNKAVVSYPELQLGLYEFLRRYKEVNIVADWPEDFLHLNRALLLGNGRMLNVPVLTMTLKPDLPPVSRISTIPHNALEDARALMRLDLHLASRKAKETHSDAKLAGPNGRRKPRPTRKQ